MAIKDEIKWFKEQFAQDILPVLAGTPLSFDLICAIAFQESGELWSKLRLHLPREEVLRLCVGDTLDRSAFPKNKNALIAAKDGQRMFDLAHQLLGEMGEGTGIRIYKKLAKRPDKFVHGYGIFQYDLQFFRRDPIFFGAALEEHRRLPREVDGGAEVSFETTRLEQQDIADRPGICFRRDRLQRRLWKFPQEPWT